MSRKKRSPLFEAFEIVALFFFRLMGGLDAPFSAFFSSRTVSTYFVA